MSSVHRVHSKLSSRIVRCLLLIVAWQAPLPAIDPLSESVFGWHLHFALPESEGETPDAPRPTRQQVLMVDGLASWDGFARLQEPLVSRAGDDGLIVSKSESADRVSEALRHSGGFFTDFAPDMPLPVRLGVLRC